MDSASSSFSAVSALNSGCYDIRDLIQQCLASGCRGDVLTYFDGGPLRSNDLLREAKDIGCPLDQSCRLLEEACTATGSSCGFLIRYDTVSVTNQ
jgi:hypothetical protein